MGLTKTVRVWTRSQTGTDPMGEPVYSWSYVDVAGVLVAEGASSDDGGGGEVADLRPDGIRVRYTLAFPKGYDGPSLRGARVTLLDPMYGMDVSADGWRSALAVSGDPRPQVRPTRWDLRAYVGVTDG